MPAAQLEKFYGSKEAAQIPIYMGYAFRGFNTHGRALFTLAHRAMAGRDEEAYSVTDEERICSMALGWNFGDGHMHNEQLIAALQRRCHFEPGEVRVVLLDAQPIHRPDPALPAGGRSRRSVRERLRHRRRHGCQPALGGRPAGSSRHPACPELTKRLVGRPESEQNLNPDEEKSMAEAVIVEAVRAPVGKRNGGLSNVHPAELSAQVLNGLAQRAGIDPAIVDDVIWGCVMQGRRAGPRHRPHRGPDGRLAGDHPGVTVDRQCGSSQQSVHFAAAGVVAGHYDAVIGGVESMSRTPMGASLANGGNPYSASFKARYERTPNQGIGAEMMAGVGPDPHHARPVLAGLP